MNLTLDRRFFLQGAALTTAGLAFTRSGFSQEDKKEKLFDISLAQWSLNRQFFAHLGNNKRGGDTEPLDPMNFATIAKEKFGIEAIEYVNQFYKDVVRQPSYLSDLKKKSADAGVKNILIMCDGEGNLGDRDTKKRITAVRNHIKWLEWAAELGCHSIRVNASSSGTYDEQVKLAADGLLRLAEIGDTYDLNVIVENHGGFSSHGRWLATVMETVNHPRCGTLPDFGNFFIARGNEPKEYDRYLGTSELMPFAKGVSAKSHDFDEQGNEKSTDYERILKIVVEAGYRGYIGIEFEGGGNAYEGIMATKNLLERVREKLSA